MNEHLPALRPDTPTAPAHDPASLDLYAPAPAAVELAAERGPVVWVPDAYGRMVPMPKHLAPPPMPMPEPRDLTPLPLVDPIAQRFLGAGLGGGALAAGVGYGIGEVINAAAGFTSGAAMWIALAVLAWRMPARALSGGRNGSTVHIRKAVIKRSTFNG
ncbi:MULTISPECIES: hypothetical protein [unclassified Streptomyces]|uniref:hypothetical protein n=1 Tax=unclassified Streptomyces TaxID=2593676 RepID=UPI00074A8DE9|nr:MULTISPECIES: hypothetical protein [unclassified Streptomyces]KUL80492.1 hypothetical protein ADL34_00785 [Streptomyces sp. NRRL WC-3605]KUL81087.1 hypothetical protein ADL33_01295 [Streptomyces sp. NRRL WC-3604]